MTRSHLSEPTMAQTREEPVEQIIEGLMRQHADSILRLCLMILQDYHLCICPISRTQRTPCRIPF